MWDDEASSPHGAHTNPVPSSCSAPPMHDASRRPRDLAPALALMGIAQPAAMTGGGFIIARPAELFRLNCPAELPRATAPALQKLVDHYISSVGFSAVKSGVKWKNGRSSVASACGMWRFSAPVMTGMFIPTLTTAQSSSKEDTYRQLGLFGDIFQRVRESYVDDIDDRELIEAAITGI